MFAGKKAAGRRLRWMRVVWALSLAGGMGAMSAVSQAAEPASAPALQVEDQPKVTSEANDLFPFLSPDLSTETLERASASSAADLLADTLGLQRPLFAQEQPDPDQQWHATVTGQFIWGPVSGYVQTPSGGKPKTTNRHRPTFDELGIGDIAVPDLEFAISYGPHQFFAGAQIIRMSGSSHLSQQLITHGVTFPAKTFVKSDIQLDWYRFGYRYPFPMFEADNGVPQLTLTPQADGVFWDFNYRISGGKRKTTRSYAKGTGQLGLDIDWRPGGGKFSIGISGLGSPPISSVPLILTGQAVLRYRFVESRAFDMNGQLGVYFERIDFHDDQQVANHVRADLGPMLIAGLQFRF